MGASKRGEPGADAELGPPRDDRRIVRTPGRVNLLGEHIDYHDLDVLPMALDRGIEVRFTPRRDGVVRLENADPRFEAVEVPVRTELRSDAPGHWGNYVRAAVTAVAALAPERGRAREVGFGGFDGVVSADLPTAAGLSSSSALVVAVARALLQTHLDPAWTPPAPAQLAELLAAGERYVGTAGGGMDQAATLGGEPGRVMRVSFAPVRWIDRPLPAEWAVIVAHTGVRAEKSGSAREAYNALRARGEFARDTLAALLGTAQKYAALRTAAPTTDLLAQAERHLDPASAAVAEHVLTEADRVDAGWAALEAGDRRAFGTAMSGSHRSLTRRCGVGHSRLDALVQTALHAGADGARLTGAGFGGSIVALVAVDRADAVLQALRDGNRDAGLLPANAPVFRA
ncbi:galactokinase family protein [Gaopeijia maritima]|uniref:galactokinase n=1 Tax=Gaopeijia maritima TaxID=3119007 RepID=UPI0032548691